jgi:hypothetical protein
MTADVTETKELTWPEQLQEKKARFFQIMEDAFGKDSDRHVKLLKMYDAFGDRLIEAPASGKTHYHNAFEGGYIDHVLHVHDNALELTRVYRNKANGWVDYTKSELVMATLHHDLGKLGTIDDPYYLVEDSQWHREKQGAMYKSNEKLQYMPVTDRALFLLQQFGIELTNKEWIAIKLSDGMYDESNKSYLTNYGKYPMHTNLPYIVHWADHMAASAERDGTKQAFLDDLNDTKE